MNFMEKDEQELLRKISLQSKVAEGPESVREILLNLYREKEIKNKRLSQLTQIPVPTLSAIRGELIKEGILENITTFTETGLKFAEEKLGFKFKPCPISESYLINFSMDQFPLNVLSKETLLFLKTYLSKRPKSDVQLDQSMATFETQIKRLSLLLMNGDLEGRSILLLGDDDATSVVLSSTDLAKRIVVLDIDERILSFVSSFPEQYQKTRIETYLADLRNPLPKNLEQSFDIVFTDPPYTLQGAKLFLQRGMYALRNKGTKFYLSYGPKQPNNIRNLQLQFNNAGFYLFNTIQAFNKYKGNLRLGQFSNLFIFKMVHTPDVLSYHKIFPYNRELYTSEVKKSESISKIDFEKTKRAIGFHIIAEMYGIDSEIILNPDLLYKKTLELCNEVQLQIVDSFLYIYPPQGLSIIITLAESHIGLHTWPEHDYMSLDVFICDEPQKAKNFVNKIKTLIKPEKVEELVIDRGVNAR